ncbi:LPS export ABC transporter permease LptF [Congregibacter litoralis]|uniref:Lipopolysaccharide export system permease protein LptF n=1 Tax=Congregibacter litoralis KT71 TaxID=314285 RepID=A4A3Y2_9GAMM|nr:LPS export ABC transporter permease LptF [Congregibacter litoralis]EAQ99405.1 putative permease [Congregibacter litoralis KT71]
MKLRGYLAGDVLGHTLAVSSVLLAIILTGRFVKYLAEAASGKLAAEILLPVMFYRLPGFLELLLPLGLFIGILMSYGRLYVESEMVILSACGVGPAKLASFTLAPALLIMLVVAGLSLLVTPQGVARSEALLNDPQALQGLQLLAAGRFQPRGDDGTVTYAADIDPEAGELDQVFLYAPEDRTADTEVAGVTVARRGSVVVDPESGVRYLELRDGYRFSGTPGRADYRIVRFGTFGQRLPDTPSMARSEPVDAKPTAALLDSDNAEDRAALHWRLSVALMVPVVALLALSLSKTNHRRGRYIKLAPALLLHLSYLFALASIRTSVAEGDAPAYQMYLLHLGFFALALLLLFGPDRMRRLRGA